VGIIMYIVITGKHPIYRSGDKVSEYILKIKDPKWTFPEDFSEPVKD
jgi:hypothetical protein